MFVPVYSRGNIHRGSTEKDAGRLTKKIFNRSLQSLYCPLRTIGRSSARKAKRLENGKSHGNLCDVCDSGHFNPSGGKLT